MKHHQAPVPEQGETDMNYIVRVVNWLAEPDRRRLGAKTRNSILEAAKNLKEEK